MKIKRLILVGLVPVSALAFFKPLRVMVPQVVSGVHCYNGGICTDVVPIDLIVAWSLEHWGGRCYVEPAR